MTDDERAEMALVLERATNLGPELALLHNQELLEGLVEAMRHDPARIPEMTATVFRLGHAEGCRSMADALKQLQIETRRG